MPKVELNAPAPDFTLTSFDGNKVSLADYRGKNRILLVFNRGFV
jgi:peroxiredoxin